MKNLLFFIAGAIVAFVFCYFLFCGGRGAKNLINYVDQNYGDEINLIDKFQMALADIERINEYDNYVVELLNKSDTRRIDLDSANCFCKLYQDRRKEIASSGKNIPNISKYDLDSDSTETVFIRMDTLIKAIFESYPGIDLTNPHTWDDKGIAVYPAYYGAIGHKEGSTTKEHKRTTVLFQMAIDSTLNTPDEWQIIKDKIYNFGGLKPPKKLKWEQVTGTVPASVNCN